MFLQEVDATVLVAGVRDFEPLARQLGPVELGMALSRFYEHVTAVVERHHGRVVKFTGSGVLAAFIGTDAIEHRIRALRAVDELARQRQAFLDENVKRSLPVLEHAVGASSGTILAGELCTDTLRFYDVFGEP